MAGSKLRFRFVGNFAEGPVLVEVEDEEGMNVDVGEWERDGEYWVLEVECDE